MNEGEEALLTPEIFSAGTRPCRKKNVLVITPRQLELLKNWELDHITSLEILYLSRSVTRAAWYKTKIHVPALTKTLGANITRKK